MSKTSLQTTNHRNNLAQWSSRIADCRSSGMTVTQWCKQHGIPKSTYYTWQRKVYNVVAWANTRNAAPKSKLGIALTYLKNQ